jgi:hypothetical protein
VIDPSLTVATANTVFILGVLAIVLARQFTTRPVRSAVYLWIGLLLLRGLLPPGPAQPTAIGIIFLVTGLVASAALGWWRGATVPMWRDATGRLVRRGNGVTLALWGLTVLVRLVITLAEYLIDHAPFNGNALWLGVGITLAAQQAAMVLRARRVPVHEVDAPDAPVKAATIRPTGAGWVSSDEAEVR